MHVLKGISCIVRFLLLELYYWRIEKILEAALLLDLRLLRRPKETWTAFRNDFNMVLSCHKERTFFMKRQPHLTNWLPIAVPLTSWVLWPPPFGHPVAALGPLGLFSVFFKFYDMLSGFNCPPSHIMNKARVIRKFPQLSINHLKYCSVFYEGQHDDARTNLAIAQTAALEKSLIFNYMNVKSTIKDNTSHIVKGVVVEDLLTGVEYNVMGKCIVACCGPFADEMINMQDSTDNIDRTGISVSGTCAPLNESNSSANIKKLVTGDIF